MYLHHGNVQSKESVQMKTGKILVFIVLYQSAHVRNHVPLLFISYEQHAS